MRTSSINPANHSDQMVFPPMRNGWLVGLIETDSARLLCHYSHSIVDGGFELTS